MKLSIPEQKDFLGHVTALAMQKHKVPFLMMFAGTEDLESLCGKACMYAMKKAKNKKDLMPFALSRLKYDILDFYRENGEVTRYKNPRTTYLYLPYFPEDNKGRIRNGILQEVYVQLIDGILLEDKGMSFETIKIRQAVKEMKDERMKKIIHLMFFEQWTQKETSEELGLSESRIMQLKNEALAILKKRYLKAA